MSKDSTNLDLEVGDGSSSEESTDDLAQALVEAKRKKTELDALEARLSERVGGAERNVEARRSRLKELGEDPDSLTRDEINSRKQQLALDIQKASSDMDTLIERIQGVLENAV